ncbi:MAG: SUMF1/EgtB/PvdO family nonheme iron enzyme, partial [Bacteroidota bacterium]
MYEILLDRKAWNSAIPPEREAVIQQLLDTKLGESFTYEGTEAYKCAGIENHVGVFRHRATDMLFHLLPGDQFRIGSGKKDAFIKRKYSMDLGEFNSEDAITVPPFLIGRYLVTEQAWAAFGGTDLFRNYGPQNPIDAVPREDIEDWSLKIGARLPSEVEWEYACKAGTRSIFYWGNQPDLNYAWTEENTDFDNYSTLTAEQQKPGNAFGLLGMIGNLGEWVADDAYHWEDGFSPQVEPFRGYYENPDGILRGGWNQYDWRFNRSTSRIACGAADVGCSARIAFGDLLDGKMITHREAGATATSAADSEEISAQKVADQARDTARAAKAAHEAEAHADAAQNAFEALVADMSDIEANSRKYNSKNPGFTIYKIRLRTIAGFHDMRSSDGKNDEFV